MMTFATRLSCVLGFCATLLGLSLLFSGVGLVFAEESPATLGAKPATATVDSTPVDLADRSALPATRRVMTLLANQSVDRFLIGQNFGHANTSIAAHHYRYVAELEAQTGAAPAMLSVDYGYEQTGPGIPSANQFLIKHWNRGGLVTASFHPRNPWRRSSVNDTGSVDLAMLLDGKSAVSIVWSGVLDRLADGLEELQEAGVVVLWRPFHEMNGDWFWWGSRVGDGLTPREFRLLWLHMFNYFTEERGLHNLIWVYSPSADYGTSTKPIEACYPGDEWVDVVAVDFYGEPRSDLFSRSLQALAKFNKPMAVAEFGFSENAEARTNLHLLQAIDASPHKPAYVVFWHGWKNAKMAIIENADADALMRSPRTKSLSDIAR